MSVRTQFAYVAAALSLILGLIAFVNPWVMVRIVGLELLDPRGLSEVRATYGAMFTLMGAVMLWAIPTRPQHASYLRFAGLLWLAAALGRFLSIIIDGIVTPMNFVGLGLELVIGIPSLMASFEKKHSQEQADGQDKAASALKAYR